MKKLLTVKSQKNKKHSWIFLKAHSKNTVSKVSHFHTQLQNPLNDLLIFLATNNEQLGQWKIFVDLECVLLKDTMKILNLDCSLPFIHPFAILCQIWCSICITLACTLQQRAHLLMCNKQKISFRMIRRILIIRDEDIKLIFVIKYVLSLGDTIFLGNNVQTCQNYSWENAWIRNLLTGVTHNVGIPCKL